MLRLNVDGWPMSQNFDEWSQLYEDELEQKDEKISSLEESLNRRDSEFERLQSELDRRQATIHRLRFERDRQSGVIARDEQAEDASVSGQPTTIAEAIEMARRQCEALSFGPRATDKLDSVNHKAGPPRKILNDLQMLNQCAQLLREGQSLGMDVMAWLKSQNVNASKESSTRMDMHAGALTFPTARGTHEQMGNHIKYHGAGLNREARIHFNVHRSDNNGRNATIDIGYVGPKIMPD